MFASAGAEAGQEVEHRRDVEAHPGQQTVAATTPTPARALAVAF